jgi:hypothetical protein
MSTTTLSCGYRHNDRRWLQICERHLLAGFDTRRTVREESRPANDLRVDAREEVQ